VANSFIGGNDRLGHVTRRHQSDRTRHKSLAMDRAVAAAVGSCAMALSDPPAGTFLGSLSDADRAGLLQAGRIAHWARGEFLVRAGDPAVSAIALLVGVVKIQKLAERGEEVLLGISGPGDLLGEIAAVREAPRSASAIALESVTGVVIAVTALRRFLLNHPSTTLALLDLSLRRLHAGNERRLEFTTRTTLTRVASRLVELTDRFGRHGPDGAIEVKLTISQPELASWSASSLESTARALRTLRQLGAIETSRLRLVVRDPELLRAQARA
jgi:CRP/FNR family cyclic AMP-dependent transcriptional regulator